MKLIPVDNKRVYDVYNKFYKITARKMRGLQPRL